MTSEAPTMTSAPAFAPAPLSPSAHAVPGNVFEVRGF